MAIIAAQATAAAGVRRRVAPHAYMMTSNRPGVPKVKPLGRIAKTHMMPAAPRTTVKQRIACDQRSNDFRKVKLTTTRAKELKGRRTDRVYTSEAGSM